MKFLALSAVVCAASAMQFDVDIAEVSKVAPKLGKMMERALTEPEVLAQELRSFKFAQIAPTFAETTAKAPSNALPIVVTHGMGDSCFNAGMKSITKAAGDHMGVYSVCVPGGDNDISDTLSGFLTTMDKNVDIFAAKVKANTNLAGGFNAFGLSQGNSVLRGYIEKYNNPPVKNYISVHGTIMGVAGFPNCNPSGLLAPVCDVLDEALGALAYDEVIQNILFQANYFRDPSRVGSEKYLANSQIAQWNNEGKNVNATFKSNFASLRSYAMVKADKDTMVYPNAGEWWGQYTPGQFKEIQQLKDTPMYTADTFGLKTANEAGKLNFEETAGEHLDFTVAQLEGWCDKYFK